MPSSAPFGEVLANLQPLAGLSGPPDGQAIAATDLPTGPLDWAPALTVQALGEHLQLITAGTDNSTEGSLADFARAQGLDDATIGWLMGQTPLAESARASGPGLPAGLLPSGMMAGLTPVDLKPVDPMPPDRAPGLVSPASSGMAPVAAGPGGLRHGVLLAGTLTSRSLAAPESAGLPATPASQALHAPNTESLEGRLAPTLPAGDSGVPGDREAAAGPAGPVKAGTHGSAIQSLAALGVSAGALWADPVRPGTSTARSGSDGAALRSEPTESLMATLRTPAATALMGLQRQLQAASPSTPTQGAAKVATANLRASDLDLSQSLGSLGGEPGAELQNLLTEWSSRLESTAAGESGHAPALTAVRGQGAMAGSPLGLAPLGSDPQLGIDLADKFELLAEKMGQAVAQRMLSELEKGHWHLKLMLRPATLGHIEVEMRMRSGELDASFVASQNLTRELLQESLPRLRETLTQLGMDVANMNVDSGRSQQGDGEPTPHAQATQARSSQADQPAQATVVTPQHRARRGQEGWDVMV